MKKILKYIMLSILVIVSLAFLNCSVMIVSRNTVALGLGCNGRALLQGNKLIYEGRSYYEMDAGWNFNPHYSSKMKKIAESQIFGSPIVFSYYVFEDDKEERYIYGDCGYLFTLEDTVAPDIINSQIYEIGFQDVNQNQVYEKYNDISLTLSQIIDSSVDVSFSQWRDVHRTIIDIVYTENQYIRYRARIYKRDEEYYLSIKDDFFKVQSKYYYLFENRYYDL